MGMQREPPLHNRVDGKDIFWLCRANWYVRGRAWKARTAGCFRSGVPKRTLGSLSEPTWNWPVNFVWKGEMQFPISLVNRFLTSFFQLLSWIFRVCNGRARQKVVVKPFYPGRHAPSGAPGHILAFFGTKLAVALNCSKRPCLPHFN